MLARRNAERADFYLQRLQEMDRALLRYVKAIHERGLCGWDGHHRAECSALFHQLGWNSFEDYVAAMETCHIAVLKPRAAAASNPRRPRGWSDETARGGLRP